LGSIDLASVFASKTQTFPIPLPEGVTNRSGVTEATVTLTVESLPMKMVTSSRISVINPPKGLKASLVGDTLQVWVRGKQGSLDAVTGDHVRVVVDLKDSGITRGQHRAAATVYLEDISDVGVVGTDYSVGVNLQ
jgi:YbbR domain-containing protein